MFPFNNNLSRGGDLHFYLLYLKIYQQSGPDADEVSLKMMPRVAAHARDIVSHPSTVLSRFTAPHRLGFRDVISKQRNDIAHTTAIFRKRREIFLYLKIRRDDR